MASRESRRRSVEADVLFQGSPVSNTLLPTLWNEGKSQNWQRTDYRIDTARGLRTKTMGIRLKQSWVNRHPEAADWVVKYLPERRTLERDLIASVGAVEPYYDKVAIGPLQRDADNAEACANYMETWRTSDHGVPYQTFAEKGAEDGPYGVVVVPTSCDMEGRPDFYDHLEEDAYAALDEAERAEYQEDEDDARGRYVRMGKDGRKKRNPAYDKGDDAKSDEAYEEALQRYLLGLDQHAATVRVIPASDCVPYLTRGTGKQRWKAFALLERTLYYETELPAEFGWQGMGDRARVPKGFEPGRTTGQNGMFYLYTLYVTWRDPKDPRHIVRPLVIYSVAGQPTWEGDKPPADKALPDNGVVVLDLYEKYGLTGPFWWWGGGLHTSDDDPDLYWEPYLWPLSETITGIEGLQTMANAATAVQSVTGYYHKPDAALAELDEEALVDAAGALVHPEVPDAGEIKTIIGDIFPASPATVSTDLWRVIALELESLRANTVLEQPGGAGSQPSGHAMIVKETIGQTAKRHIREAALDATKFCGEAVMKILTAIEREYDVRWPLQTVKESPVGQEMRESEDILTWNSEWVGTGQYRLVCEYPEEPNPVAEQQEMAKIQLGVGSFEALCKASGITDVETAWSKVIKTQMRMDPAYRQMMMTRLAKRQGNKLMLQVLKLQQQGQMTQQGVPGMPAGVPTSALNGPGEQNQGGGMGGPTYAQSSLGGQMAAEVAPQMQDARAQLVAGRGA